MPSFTDRATRSLKHTKSDKPKMGVGIPDYNDGYQGETRIQIVEGNPRLYLKTGAGWFFTGLVQDGAIPDVPTATSTRLGVIKIGDGGTVASDGTYTATAATPAADNITGGDDAVNITTSSGNITIDAAANNSDVIFKGTDNTSDITMLTLDGSEAGNAIFNANVTVGALLIMPDVTNHKILVSDGTSYQEVAMSGDATIANTGAITLAAAQTNVNSILATDLILGEDSQTAIDFGTANEIDFKADNAARLTLASDKFYPVTDNQIDLGTTSLRFKTAYFEGLSIASLSEQASEATALMINGSSVVGWRELGSAAFAGTGDFMAADANANMASVTGTLAVGNGGTGATTLNNLITLSTHTTGNYVATVSAGDGIDVSGSGSEGAGVTVTAEDSTASNKGAVIVAGGTNCTVSYSSGTATVNVSTSAYKESDDVETVALGGTGQTSVTAYKNVLDDETWTFAEKITADAGIDIDNINIDGTTIALSSGNLTLDAAGDIYLDAGGADIVLLDDSTHLGTIKLSSSAFRFDSQVSDQDITFTGNDGGSAITALTLDMSDAGTATFNNNITTSADKRLSVGTWDNSGFSGSAMYGLSITSSVPIVHLAESDETGKKAYFGMSGGNAYLGGNTITNLYFQTGSGTTALTIDSSQVALFASTIRGSADIVAYYSSDPSLKENKELIQSPLDKISQLGGYSFDWKEEAKDIVGDHLNGKDYGVMADEVQALFPELVDTRSNGIRAVKYDKLVPLLIEGIKELKEELNMIKEQS